MNSGEFIELIIQEYENTKQRGFDSISIIVETNGQEYKISEYEDGFTNDGLNGVYSNIKEISEEIFNLIDCNEDKVRGFRIE